MSLSAYCQFSPPFPPASHTAAEAQKKPPIYPNPSQAQVAIPQGRRVLRWERWFQAVPGSCLGHLPCLMILEIIRGWQAITFWAFWAPFFRQTNFRSQLRRWFGGVFTILQSFTPGSSTEKKKLRTERIQPRSSLPLALSWAQKMADEDSRVPTSQWVEWTQKNRWFKSKRPKCGSTGPHVYPSSNLWKSVLLPVV